ncbi:mechanosensitive ion channel family protein [Marinigracilibium pacificum]|uniref:Mechanosensitive ion channel n=1 Tax=Marinigracilibium pacificum TaxID=2729599 RepID=A0A848J415_9BACT|nr:mechanosensitive ion channel domain-containing protein [Marinigracilibium pacificum]NMM49224.1 mechanosensitive ion channel [Marinigracilibium pacificum]
MFKKIKDSFIDQLNIYYDELITILPKLSVGIIIFLVFYFLAKGAQRFLSPRLAKKFDDVVMGKFITDIIFYSILLIGALFFLQIIGYGQMVVGIFSGAGVAAIIFGFAFKDIGENFIAGVIMAFNRPFKKGDLIKVGEEKGRVQAMTLRSTRIKTYDGKDIFIPNATIIKGNLTNYTVDGFLRYEISLGMDYGTDLAKTAEIIINTALKIDGVLKEPAPSVYLTDYGTNTVNLKYTIWVDLFDPTFRRFDIKSNVMMSVWNALNDAGFNMPGNIVEIKNYSTFPFKISTTKDNPE